MILGILCIFYKMPFLYGSSINIIGHTSTQLALHSVCTIQTKHNFSVVIHSVILDTEYQNWKNHYFDIVRLPVCHGTMTRSNITWEWKKVLPFQSLICFNTITARDLQDICTFFSWKLDRVGKT